MQYNYDAEESSEMNYLQNKLMGRQELNGGKKERRIGHFEEQFEVDTDNGVFEKIDVPEFLDCRRATVLHDFERVSTICNAFVFVGEKRIIQCKITRYFVCNQCTNG